jgi:hypothetical protein
MGKKIFPRQKDDSQRIDTDFVAAIWEIVSPFRDAYEVTHELVEEILFNAEKLLRDEDETQRM